MHGGTSSGCSSPPSAGSSSFYPNIAALPLPSTIVNAYQGLLPTYLYAFQFPVSDVARNVDTPLLSGTLAILTIAIGVTLPGRRLLGLGVAAGARGVRRCGGLRARATARTASPGPKAAPEGSRPGILRAACRRWPADG